MAPGLRLWLAAPLAACAAIAFALLPPRGEVGPPGVRFGPRQPRVTAARLRAQGLADQWRAAQGALELAELRERSTPSGSLTVLLTGVDQLPAGAPALVRATLDSIWGDLGLAETKVGVVFILQLHRAARPGDVPVYGPLSATYLLPDSGHRTTCAVLLPAGLYTTEVLLERRPRGFNRERWRAQFAQSLQAGLGPCAFYAAFGTPGKAVGSWLARRKFDLALLPAWVQPRRGGLVNPLWFDDPMLPHLRWYWDMIYRFSPSTVACLGGRAEACAAAVLDESGPGYRDTAPSLIATEFRGFWRTQRLLPGERFLGEVASDIGRERFVQFWSSPEPVDTALAAALRMPVGEWTARWERRHVPRLRLGPAQPPGAVALALLLAVAAVGAVAASARRRQVR
jgi:hypothetical protein